MAGDIVISGGQVSPRYILNEERNLFHKLQIIDVHKVLNIYPEICHKTGDMGYIDQNNKVWFVSRSAHCFSVNRKFPTNEEEKQMLIFPDCIEGIVNHHLFICRSACVGIRCQLQDPDFTSGKKPFPTAEKVCVVIELFQEYEKFVDLLKLKKEMIEKIKNSPLWSWLVDENLIEIVILSENKAKWLKSLPVDKRHNSKIERFSFYLLFFFSLEIF